ncbi:MAG: hypothetical protein H0W74_08365 [Sphingosinicella sp.]|nr:hypothetical protein [Sphingosinicella sp.]
MPDRNSDEPTPDVSPIVERERSRGTVLTFAALGLLVLLALFLLLGGDLFDTEPLEERNEVVHVGPGR